MLLSLAIFALLGMVAGLLAGLFGIGGGLVMVPALIYLLPPLGVNGNALAHMAVGTSLACVSLIAINSARSHHHRDGVDWRVFRWLAPGMVVGALAGAAVADSISSLFLQRLIGMAAVLMAVRMFIEMKPSPSRELPGKAGLIGVGGGIGGLSALLGIGGGSLTVPFLSWCRLPMARAVGTSAACGMPIAWAGTVGMIWAGLDEPGRGAWSIGFVQPLAVAGIVLGSLVFTPLGVRLAHHLPGSWLRRAFAVLLMIVGLDMLLTA